VALPKLVERLKASKLGVLGKSTTNMASFVYFRPKHLTDYNFYGMNETPDTEPEEVS